MKKLFRIDESEKKRILSMHTNATSRQYLSEQENNEDPDFTSAKEDLISSSSGPGTNERGFRLALQAIPNQKFDNIIALLMSTEMNGEDGLNELLKSEFGRADKDELIKIKNILDTKGKMYTLHFTMDQWNRNIRSFDIMTIEDATKLDAKSFYEKWPCLEDENYTNIRVISRNNEKYFQFTTNGVVFNVALSTGKLYEGNSDTGEIARCAEERQDIDLMEGLVNDRVKNATSSTSDSEQEGSQEQQPTQQQGGNRARSGSSGLLKRGSNSEEVVTAKMKINKALPNVIEDLQINTSDPNFDDKTVAAVAYFQAKNGLKVDGIIGDNTRGKLNNITLDDQQQGGEQPQQPNPNAGEGNA